MGERETALLARATEALAGNAVLITELNQALSVKTQAEDVGRAIIGAGKWFTVAEAAKELAIDLGDGKRLGPNQLYAFLRSTHMVLRRRDPSSRWQYHHPFMEQVDAGRMKLEDRVTAKLDDSGHRVIYRQTLISPGGIAYIRTKVMAAIEEGILDELIG